MAYVFRNPDQAVIGKALDAIAAANDGRLYPAQVVDAARPPEAALHPFFEWNDTAAAEAYRLEQARSLIRIVHIEDEALDEPPRLYLSVKDHVGTAYRRYDEVRQSIDLSMAMLQGAERDMLAFIKRYRSLQELLPMADAMLDAIRRQMTDRKRPGDEAGA